MDADIHIEAQNTDNNTSDIRLKQLLLILRPSVCGHKAMCHHPKKWGDDTALRVTIPIHLLVETYPARCHYSNYM